MPRDALGTEYAAAHEHAAARGILLADTKFEFGLDADGVVTLFPSSGPEIEVRLDESDSSAPTCVIAMLSLIHI